LDAFLWEATFEGNEIRFGSHRLILREATFENRPGLRAYDGKTTIVGVRPGDLEDARLVADIEAGTTITSMVDLTEALGSGIVTHSNSTHHRQNPAPPDAADDARGGVVARFDPRSTCRAGDAVDVAVTVGNLHFFDLDTHMTIGD